jgi:fatty acid desaturase
VIAARDMRVFDELEAAERYLERAEARVRRRRIVALTSVAAAAGLVGAVAFNARLLLAGGEYSPGEAAAWAAAGTIPLLLGVGAYLAGLRALSAAGAGPDRPLLGVVDPPEEH